MAGCFLFLLGEETGNGVFSESEAPSLSFTGNTGNFQSKRRRQTSHLCCREA